MGNEDLTRLEKAFESFNGTVGKMSSSGQPGGARVTGGATSTDYLESRSSREIASKKETMTQAALAAMPNAISIGKTGGLASRAAGLARAGIDEIPGKGPIGKGGFLLAFGPQIMNSVAGISGAASGAIYGGGLTAAGTQLGQSNRGFLGTGIGSPAFNTGFLNQVAYPLANITNPYASEAQGIASQYGYNVSQGQNLFNMFGIGGSGSGSGQRAAGMLQNAMAQGVSGDTAAQWLESIRYGGSNIGLLSDRLHELGRAAIAAHMSVATFSQQLSETGQAYSQSTGASSGFASDQAMALSRATGLTPGALTGTLTSQPLQGMAVAMAGGDMAKAFMGRNAGLNNLKAMEQMVVPQLGYSSFAALAVALKDPRKRHDIVNRLLWIYQSPGGKDLLGGMSPTEFLAMVQRTGGMAGITAGFHASQDIQNAPRTNFSARMIGSELGRAGYDQSKITSILSDNSLTAKQKIDQLSNLQAARQNKRTDLNNQITLTGYAAKIFKFAAQQYDKSHSNGAQDTSTPASTYVQPPR